ncbi:MAG: glycosyltransferase family 4 protein [Salinivirgaceae bacterium]|nr:glycosyltransferase family 4 protein [Salinivirgaceae bacterium]
MKIIYDDIIYSLQKSGGISAYWNYLENYISVNNRFLYRNCSENIFYHSRNNSIHKDRNVLIERYQNVRVEEPEPFVFHSSYYRYCKNNNAINVTTIHDFTYELFRKDLLSNLHKWQKKNAILHSDGVICISQNTLSDFRKMYPNYNGKSTVIYHGYDKSTFNFTDSQRNNNVIFVGSRAAYKGFNLSVQLINGLKDLFLVIVGGGDLTKDEIKMLNEHIPNRYCKLSFISNLELAELYNKSFALFYPSSYEGFGFPVIESQACGCPVICQEKSSIPEISGGKCIYIDPTNVEESITRIKQLQEKTFYKELQHDALENVKRFSWDKTISNTISFYEHVYNNK